MGITTDRNDPNLHITDPSGMQRSYLVLSEDERAKGFVRPVRRSYQHTTCGSVTTMGLAIAETYARDPHFYGATFCYACRRHVPVAECLWDDDSGDVVGS
jgi:hypothetical protein